MIKEEEAFRKGRDFYRDFIEYHDRLDINEEFFREDLVEGIVMVEMIGKGVGKGR